MEKKPLVRERVADELKLYVSQLRTNTQVKIPSERALSESFHVSRITLRAALKELVDEGILVQLKGKGTYITPNSELRHIHLICSDKIKDNDPFYLKFLSELTSTGSKKAVNLLIVDPAQVEKVPFDIPLVIIGLFEDSNLMSKLISSYKTIVAIQDYNNYNDVISQIYFHDYKIGWEAAHLLAAYQHKKLLLLAGPEKYPSSCYRKKGFLDALESIGMEAVIHTEKMNWAGGYNSGDYILKELPLKDRPSAVFAANDWMAIGLMQKLKENGIRIPEDISVVGCDDIPLASEFVPTLTTFDLDMKYLVTELFTLINKLSGRKENMIRKIVLPATLVMRDSLKRFNEKA